MTRPDLDKRKGKQRIQRRLPVRFGTDAKMCGGQVADISEGGMRVESAESFPVNSVITVFVQFPRHSLRLKTRVAWCGAAGGSSQVVMGLALTQPEPALKRACAEWVAEVKQAAAEAAASGAPPAPNPASAATPPGPAALAAPPAAGPKAPGPRAPEPRGPVKRRLESRQGQAYDALLEREPEGWSLTIVQLPRQAGIGAPDFQSHCPDYASAEEALREFVRTH